MQLPRKTCAAPQRVCGKRSIENPSIPLNNPIIHPLYYPVKHPLSSLDYSSYIPSPLTLCSKQHLALSNPTTEVSKRTMPAHATIAARTNYVNRKNGSKVKFGGFKAMDYTYIQKFMLNPKKSLGWVLPAPHNNLQYGSY